MPSIVQLNDDQLANLEHLKHDPDLAWLWDTIEAGRVEPRSTLVLRLGPNDVEFGTTLSELEGRTVDLHLDEDLDSVLTVHVIRWTRSDAGWETIDYAHVDEDGAIVDGTWGRSIDVADVRGITIH